MKIVGIGAIFIDDIVLPDGQTHMGTLGGGAVHAMMGAALWDERPGLCAFVGRGVPDDIVPRLAGHLDVEGLLPLDLPQARAWQIFEHDGTRRELHRVEHIAPFVAGTTPENLPPRYRHADGYFLLQNFQGIRKWGDLPGIKLWEPNQLAMLAGDRATMRDVLRNCDIDIVSPNLHEARAIYGDHSPAELVQMMMEDGARLVILRMGREGSLIMVGDGQRHHVPALTDVQAVDETGAGNTYNGAFLAGMVQGRSLLECGRMATVAASFCVEQVGVIDLDKIDHAERDKRYNRLVR